ncbi:MAG: UTP--glucose-1-phosphate uridylyltransferase [Fibromonadaceae bacterium]|jgi:phosphomannomutase|nr:UTP--glucose-1-phosphate uridylyltransferase [Fibromonadaceae bacterium]
MSNKIQTIMDTSGVAFGTSGARGLVSDMTDEVCYAYTLGFLQHTLRNKNAKKIAAFGGDLRPSTPRIIAACMAAAKSLGFECDYQGFLPSPALALYSIKKGIPSIMVTGSHIPDNRNGIKFCDYYGEITKDDEQSIRAQNVELPTSHLPLATSHYSNNAALKMYKEYVLSLFPKNALQNMNIAFYQHSAVGRDIAVEILAELGANVKAVGRSEKFIPVDTEAIRKEDVDFAKDFFTVGATHRGCPSSGEKFFCMISTDGDSDRPLLSDENGNWFRGDSLGILAAKALGIEAIAIPVSCNTAAEKSGFFKEVLRTKIGSPYVIEGMKKLQYKSVAGYEANGGFLTESLTTRDALTPVIATIIESKKQGLKLSELLATLPPRYASSGLVKEFPPELADEIISNPFSPNNTKPVSINTTDGYRMEFENGDIVHLRKSGNAPEFRCYTESETIEQAENLSAKCTKILEAKKIIRRGVLHTPNQSPQESLTPMNFQILQSNPNFEKIGNEILQKKQIAAFLLAGGQGSRLGFEGPKGAFKLEALNKSIFQIHAENLRGKDIPWVIMTSPLNHKETLEHFEQADYFGLSREKIKFIEQNTICAMTPSGEPIFDSEGNLALVPDGNGGCFRALSSSGALAWLQEQGIEFVFLYGVDNILAKPCDPIFIGAFVDSKMAAGSKVVKKKHPEERMGVFALKNGLPTVIEYSEIPQERKAEFDGGNIVAHLFSMESLKKLENEPLPWHLAIKRVCNVEGAYKFEQFLFDAFPKLGTMFLAGVEREKEFAPIKNASGEDSPESAVKLFCMNKQATP